MPENTQRQWNREGKTKFLSKKKDLNKFNGIKILNLPQEAHQTCLIASISFERLKKISKMFKQFSSYLFFKQI